jgi:hypothetical protein
MVLDLQVSRVNFLYLTARPQIYYYSTRSAALLHRLRYLPNGKEQG